MEHEYDEEYDGTRGKVTMKSFGKYLSRKKAMPDFSERYQARVERLLGITKRKSKSKGSKCPPINMKPRVRSKYSVPTSTGLKRCIKRDTAAIRKNLKNHGKEALVAVSHSKKIKPHRSLAGNMKKYKFPRIAVARSGSRTNHAKKTGGGLQKSSFTVNKWGRLVSKKASASAKARFNKSGSDSKMFLKQGQSKLVSVLSKSSKKLSVGQKALVRTLAVKKIQGAVRSGVFKKKTAGKKFKRVVELAQRMQKNINEYKALDRMQQNINEYTALDAQQQQNQNKKWMKVNKDHFPSRKKTASKKTTPRRSGRLQKK
jgi:hypothetical protein